MQFSSTGSSPEFPLASSDSSSMTKGLNFKHLLHSQRIPGWVRLEGSSGPTSLPIPELMTQDCEQSFTLALLLTPKSWPPSCQNKPPHTDPRESSHLGGRCHHQLWVVNFIFPKGEKKSVEKSGLATLKSCICWQYPVSGNVFLIPAGQNASKERVQVLGTWIHI